MKRRRGAEELDALLSDFSALASAWAPLKAHLVRRRMGSSSSPQKVSCDQRNRPGLDFSQPASQRELTRAQLHVGFGLKNWDAPLDRLCPPVPNRLNYLRWLDSLLSLRGTVEVEECATGEHPAEMQGREGCKARILDIGTGASCIYPLLGAAEYGWSFLATDTDETSLSWAKRNVEANPQLASFITLRHVMPFPETGKSTDQGPIEVSLQANSRESWDFVMTNPPFFDNRDDPDEGNPLKATSQMAKASERMCNGGEFEFVRRMILDSMRMRTRIRWYTAMLGRKESLREICRELKAADIKNVRSTEFLQGKHVRWGIAWSFTEEGLVNGCVPDDPSMKERQSTGMTQVGHKLERFVRSERFYFSCPLKGSYSHSSYTVGCGDKARTLPVPIPCTLPESKDSIIMRIDKFISSYQREINVKLQDVLLIDNALKVEDALEWTCGGSSPTLFAHVSYVWKAKGRAMESNEESVHAFDFDVGVGYPIDQDICVVIISLEERTCGAKSFNKAAFVRMCEAMHGDVVRQNRKWRRKQHQQQGEIIE